jgi:uncharacterized repeat protein (TIGR02059 family)
MTYNKTLANIIPAPASFTVMVNSVARTVNLVTISGTNVQLTLSGPVVFGDVVTVAYTRPATNPIQTSAGEQAASISAQSVTNNLAAPSPVYVSSAVQNATPTLVELTYDMALANIIPASSAFTVMVNSVGRVVNSVTVSGTTVRLALASAVVYGDAVTVAYTKPAITPLQTSSGGQAATFTAKTVTNGVNPAIPVYVSSVIQNATPTLLEMTYNITLANIIPAFSAFTVIVNSVGRAVNSVTVSGTTVRLALASAVVYGDAVTVAYTKPAINPLQTSSGGQAATFTAKTVTNGINPAIPVYVSSVIQNTTPDLLEMTYNVTLANIIPASSAFTVMVNSVSRAVNTVTVSGTTVRLTLASAVAYGDIVTVAYTKPAINPLQTSSGGQAATISSQSVTIKNNSVIPVSVSYVINNNTPRRLTINYNLALANIVPASGSFQVLVNNVPRAVKYVVISGSKVQLTLAYRVQYRDVVTVGYNKPVSNPIQTPAGGQAKSLSAQVVTNNCQTFSKSTDLSIKSLTSETSVSSGFVYEIDGSGVYDPNNDIVAYKWTVPGNVAVSSSSGPTIKFLSPVLTKPEDIILQLSVTNDSSSVLENFPVKIVPYKSGLEMGRIIKAEASEFYQSDFPKNVADDNQSSKWSVSGDNQWLLLKLAEPFKISYLQLSFLPDQHFASYFDIYASTDSLIWEPVLTQIASCEFSGDLQVFDFPDTRSDIEYSFIKLVGHGNSANAWNYISEFKLYGTGSQLTSNPDSKTGEIIIYPNPAREFITVTMLKADSVPLIIRIIDVSGKINSEVRMDPGLNNLRIPIDLKSGVYIVQVVKGNMTVFAKKLIVRN